MTIESDFAKSALWLERYSPETTKVINTQLLIAQKKILELIASTENKAIIKSEVNKIMSEAFSTFDTVLADDVENINKLSFDVTNTVMATYVASSIQDQVKNYRNVSKDIRSKLNNPNNLVQGHTIDEHFKHLDRQTTMKIQGTILKGFDDGSGIDAINREVKNIIGSVNRNQSKTIIRTTLLEASERSKNASLLENYSDVILGFRYSAVIDTRTTKICMLNHNIRHKRIEDFKVLPKNHYSCRSMLLPITEISEELDKNAEMNIVQWNGKSVQHRTGEKSTKFKVGSVKKIQKDTKGIDLIRSFDDKYLKDYIGPTRYKLYKDNRASLDEMFNISRGEMITLDKLNRKLNLD